MAEEYSGDGGRILKQKNSGHRQIQGPRVQPIWMQKHLPSDADTTLRISENLAFDTPNRQALPKIHPSLGLPYHHYPRSKIIYNDITLT